MELASDVTIMGASATGVNTQPCQTRRRRHSLMPRRKSLVGQILEKMPPNSELVIAGAGLNDVAGLALKFPQNSVRGMNCYDWIRETPVEE